MDDGQIELHATGSALFSAAARATVGLAVVYVLSVWTESVGDDRLVDLAVGGIALWSGVWVVRLVRWATRPVYLLDDSELHLCGLFGDDAYALDRLSSIWNSRDRERLYATFESVGGTEQSRDESGPIKSEPDRSVGVVEERYTVGLPLRALAAADRTKLRSELSSRSRVSARTFEASSGARMKSGLAFVAASSAAGFLYAGTPIIVRLAGEVFPDWIAASCFFGAVVLLAVMITTALRAFWLFVRRVRHPVYSIQGDAFVVHGLLWDRRWPIGFFENIETSQDEEGFQIQLYDRVSARSGRGTGPVGIVRPIPGKRPRKTLDLSVTELPEEGAAALVGEIEERMVESEA